MPLVEASLEMWVTFALIAGAVVAYATEWLPVEVTALGVLAALLVVFQLSPLLTGRPEPLLDAAALLEGFASPALLAVCALLVVGQAMINTGALEGIARLLVWLSRDHFRTALGLSLGGVMALSAFLNNTPIVIIFLPIMIAIAERYRRRASAVMMPLSFAAILGGMTTLIGSSTNLLVSAELVRMGQPRLGFFDFTVPGVLIALVGGAYVLLLPRILPKRAPRPGLPTPAGRQFIAEIDVEPGSPLIGQSAANGLFPALPEVTLRLVQRGERAILPPFEDIELEAGDVLIVAATRSTLTQLLSSTSGHRLTLPEHGRARRQRGPGDVVLTEAMVKPASRMIGQTIELTNFPSRSQCTVLGVQRRARMVRSRLGDLRLEAGDVLLLGGHVDAIERLRGDQDVLVMEWSATEMPRTQRAPIAALIFALVVVPAALELLPIVVSAILGAFLLIATGCLNIRQAARAVDRRIVLMIASSLAMATALEATGGAAFLAMALLELMRGASPPVVLAGLFLLIATLTNLLSNNATAVLFTPIAVNVAAGLQVDVLPFALAVLFAANCSFATPIGYQTNLLVMGPGHYRFADFIRAGLPLILLVWVTFCVFAPWYYGLW